MIFVLMIKFSPWFKNVGIWTRTEDRPLLHYKSIFDNICGECIIFTFNDSANFASVAQFDSTKWGLRLIVIA